MALSWVGWGSDPVSWRGGTRSPSTTRGQRATLIPHLNWDRPPPIPGGPYTVPRCCSRRGPPLRLPRKSKLLQAAPAAELGRSASDHRWWPRPGGACDVARNFGQQDGSPPEQGEHM